MESNDVNTSVIQIANEFTVVTIKHVLTGGGERLVIKSQRLGFETQLDPMQLESLTWQPPALYSTLLKTPLGPGADIRALPDLV